MRQHQHGPIVMKLSHYSPVVFTLQLKSETPPFEYKVVG